MITKSTEPKEAKVLPVLSPNPPMMQVSNLTSYFNPKHPGDEATNVRCHLCAGLLFNPRVFECKKHSYCHTCLEKADPEFACPLCQMSGKDVRRTVPVADLPIDDAAYERVNDVRCFYCQNELEVACANCGVACCLGCREKHRTDHQCREFKPVLLETVDVGLNNLRKDNDIVMSGAKKHIYDFRMGIVHVSEDFNKAELMRLMAAFGPVQSEIGRVLALPRRQILREGTELLDSVEKNLPSLRYIERLSSLKEKVMGDIDALWELMVRRMKAEAGGEVEEEEEEEEPPSTPVPKLKSPPKPGAKRRRMSGGESIDSKDVVESIAELQDLARNTHHVVFQSLDNRPALQVMKVFAKMAEDEHAG